MKTNGWMRSGGFYGNDARIISDAGLDIAAHPRVLLKQAETARIKTEETTDKALDKKNYLLTLVPYDQVQ